MWGGDKIHGPSLEHTQKCVFFGERKKEGGGAKIKSMILVWDSDKNVAVSNLPWFMVHFE